MLRWGQKTPCSQCPFTKSHSHIVTDRSNTKARSVIGGGLQSGFQMNSNYGVAPYVRYSPDVENNMVNELFSMLLLLLLLLERAKHFI